MTPEIILTMIVLVFVIVLFIFEWVRVDVVGILMMVLLPLAGLISPKEAFVGLSSNAVCSIIAVIIIGAGLDKTGVMNQVAGPIIKLAGKSEKRIMILISGTVGIISSMMQNIGAAALFLPAAQRIAKRMEVPVSRILMPMGFCAITGVLSIDEAYRAVDWMTVFLLAGLIPLGIAFEKTGTAALIAQSVLALIGNPSPIVLLAVVGLMTSFFTLVISNVGATVLLVPLCMNMAVMAGGDPRMAALVVGLSASNTFVLPTQQVNALVMRPGGYRTVDYAKAGIVVTAIFLTVELTILYFFYGIQ